MRSRRIRLLAAFILCSCGSSPTAGTTHDETTSAGQEAPPEPAAPPPQAHIRLIHAAIESVDQAVTLVADGVTASEPTAYQFSSASLSLTPGEHAVAARANDTELIQASFTFPEGVSTLIAYSTGDFPVALSFVTDSSEAGPAEASMVRVFHAIVGQGPIDVCAPSDVPRADGTPILANIAPGTLGAPGYVQVAAGAELPLQVRAGNAIPCHGRPIGTTRFTPAAQSNYTLIFVGRTGRHHAAPELLFCADPPASDTSCATVAVEASR